MKRKRWKARTNPIRVQSLLQEVLDGEDRVRDQLIQIPLCELLVGARNLHPLPQSAGVESGEQQNVDDGDDRLLPVVRRRVELDVLADDLKQEQ